MLVPCKRLYNGKNAASSIALVFCINLLDSTRAHRKWFTDFTEELQRLLVQTDHRPLACVRTFIHVDDVFHASDKIGILLLRNAPIAFQVRAQCVFFNIRRTASSPAVRPSSTLVCSVRSLMVHLAYPSGGLPQAVAMILASMAPSSCVWHYPNSHCDSRPACAEARSHNKA